MKLPESYDMTKKLQQTKKRIVTVTSSIYAGFGAGYISYIEKTIRLTYSKKTRYTLYIYININYYFLLIFNVTNVTRLLNLYITGLSGLRYNVTS